jgi:hypothetical protein
VISVCDGQDQVNMADALAMLDRALSALAAADAGSLPTPVQAQALRALERAEAKHTAVRAQILAAFTAQDGFEDDGQGSARMWLRWQTRVTKAAAAGAVGRSWRSWRGWRSACMSAAARTVPTPMAMMMGLGTGGWCWI